MLQYIVKQKCQIKFYSIADNMRKAQKIIINMLIIKEMI